MKYILKIQNRLDGLFYRIATLLFKTPEKREGIRQFLTFAVIGGMNTVIDFGIYYLLTRHTQLFDYHTPWKYVANSISFLTATTFSFWMNRSWTFRRSGWPTVTEGLRFYTTTIGGLLVNNSILFFFNEFVGINDLISKVFSTLFSMIWNFFFKKFWVFTSATEVGSEVAA